MAANVETPGSVAVDAAKLAQIVNAMPEPTVQLTLKDRNRLEILSGRSKFKLPATPADEFPPLPDFEEKTSATVQEGALRALVERAGFAVAPDDVRYGLNGAHLEERVVGDAEEGKKALRMVSTDGHRLACGEIPYEGELYITPRSLIPRKALGMMRKLLDPAGGSIAVSFGDGAIRLTRPETETKGAETFWFRLLDGEFPDYNAVLPTSTKHQATVDRGAFLTLLKRVGIMAAKGQAVKFVLSDDEMLVSFRSLDGGDVQESMEIELDGEPLTTGFNLPYLQDALGAVQGDRVEMALYSQLSPCLISDPEDKHAFCVVMPMRID